LEKLSATNYVLYNAKTRLFATENDVVNPLLSVMLL